MIASDTTGTKDMHTYGNVSNTEDGSVCRQTSRSKVYAAKQTSSHPSRFAKPPFVSLLFS